MAYARCGVRHALVVCVYDSNIVASLQLVYSTLCIDNSLTLVSKEAVKMPFPECLTLVVFMLVAATLIIVFHSSQ